MSVEFRADAWPSKELVADAAALTPANPFYTPRFMESMRVLGSEPLVLSLREDGRLISACTAFMKAGRLNRSLEITSLPGLSDPEVFWQGLLRFCREARVSHLTIGSFASAVAAVPPLESRWGDDHGASTSSTSSAPTSGSSCGRVIAGVSLAAVKLA